eukprot:4843384-Pleurochrysis_carterae.AAC.1
MASQGTMQVPAVTPFQSSLPRSNSAVNSANSSSQAPATFSAASHFSSQWAYLSFLMVKMLCQQHQLIVL